MSKKVMLFLVAFALFSAVANPQPFQKGRMCGMMDWMPQQGISQEKLPERDSAQAKTYARFCAQCHALPNPAQHSKEDWSTLVERMDARMKMMGQHGGMMMREHGMMGGMMGRMMNVKAMTADEKSVILEYLQKHSMKTAEGLEKLESITGFAEFKKTCSQCHALPDPFLHAKDEWPEVVNRMESHIYQRGLENITGKDKAVIVSFLGEALKK